MDISCVSSQCGFVSSGVCAPQSYCTVPTASREGFAIGGIHYGTEPVCGVSQCFFMLPRHRVPQPHCLVITGSGKCFAIWRKRYSINTACVLCECGFVRACLDIPQAGSIIATASRNGFAIDSSGQDRVQPSICPWLFKFISSCPIAPFS